MAGLQRAHGGRHPGSVMHEGMLYVRISTWAVGRAR